MNVSESNSLFAPKVVATCQRFWLCSVCWVLIWCIWFGHWSSLLSHSACLLSWFHLCFRGFVRKTPSRDILDGFGGEPLSVCLAQLAEQHAGLSKEQAALAAATDCRLSALEERRAATLEERVQEASLSDQDGALQEHIVLERSASESGRSEPGGSTPNLVVIAQGVDPAIVFIGGVVTGYLIITFPKENPSGHASRRALGSRVSSCKKRSVVQSADVGWRGLSS